MREKFNLPPLHITTDKRQYSFCQSYLLQLLLSANVMHHYFIKLDKINKKEYSCKQ